ncbi:MAG: hypothetical protein BGN89_01480 [Alphaproteobacteria bacterium 64-6]|nr:MAG: hypothetical protein BGN89_01480 [Alphaproteobacteria bacterium 64-6]
MSVRSLTFVALGAGIALAATAPALFAQARTQLGALNGNEGIYVSKSNFGIVKGSPKTDPAAQIMKLGAQEVKEGAIIMRVGDKLYLVDTDPAAESMYSGWAAEAFSPDGG